MRVITQTSPDPITGIPPIAEANPHKQTETGQSGLLTELYLPPDFDRRVLRHWTDRIESPRLRTLVSRRTREVLNKREDVQ